jgi:hypothetical protein
MAPKRAALLVDGHEQIAFTAVTREPQPVIGARPCQTRA